jgi:hypothetical protein
MNIAADLSLTAIPRAAMLPRYTLIPVFVATLVVGCQRQPNVQEVRSVPQTSDTTPEVSAPAFDSVAAAIRVLEKRASELAERLDVRERELAELRERVERLEAVRR